MLNTEDQLGQDYYMKNEIDAHFYTSLITDELQEYLKEYIKLKTKDEVITFKIPYSMGEFNY